MSVFKKRKLPYSLILVALTLGVLILPDILHKNTLPALGYQYVIPKTPAIAPMTNLQTKPFMDTKAVALPANREAWLLYLDATTNKNAALTLQNKLLMLGYAATIGVEQTPTITSYRVEVGPVIGKADAKTLQTNINQALAVSSKLVLYNPITTT